MHRGVRRLRRGLRFFTSDKVAAAHMVYFMVSAALFLPLIGGVLYFMQDVTDAQFDEDAGLEPRARNLLDRLTTSPGAYRTDSGSISTFWQDRDDATQPLLEAGFRHDTQRLRLSPEKLDNLNRGDPSVNHSDTPFVDYPELKAALGLDDRFDFHLRMAPNLQVRDLDPYGSRPLGAAHVAYVGELDNPGVFNREIDEFKKQAKTEINALDALGLGPYIGGQQGFAQQAYYPAECPAPTIHGTVIADTTKSVEGRGLLGTCISPETRPYIEWFLDDYFWDETNEKYRFDALIFGSGVDLERWANTADTIGNKGIFLDFVERGGTIIFLDNTLLPDDFVTNCTAIETHCLFSETGAQVPLRVPDDTNQMLRAPNQMPAFPLRGDGDKPWQLWNNTQDPPDLLNETYGFIPMLTKQEPWSEPLEEGDPYHLSVHVGATTADRYGGDGGTVILADWDLNSEDEESEEDISKMFANLLNYGLLRYAYLDYGPELPEDRVVRAVAKTGVVEAANGEIIEVRLQLYLWRS